MPSVYPEPIELSWLKLPDWRAAQLALLSYAQQLARKTSAWNSLTRPVQDAVLARRTEGLDALLRPSGGQQLAYATWCWLWRKIGPPQRKPLRGKLYARRAAIRRALPDRLRDASLDEVALQYPTKAAELRDIETRLEQTRVGVAQRGPQKDWRNSADLRSLRRWYKHLALELTHTGYDGSTKSEQVQADLEQLRSKIRLIELEQYEVRMREWTAARKDPDNFYETPRTVPRRPAWLRAQDAADAADAKCAEQYARSVVVFEAQCERAAAQQRLEVERAAARSRLAAARKANHLDDLRRKLLEWAREMQAWRCGLEVEAAGKHWLYFDTDEIPHHDRREHVLEACAVRVSTGWCFEVLGD